MSPPTTRQLLFAAAASVCFSVLAAWIVLGAIGGP